MSDSDHRIHANDVHDQNGDKSIEEATIMITTAKELDLSIVDTCVAEVVLSGLAEEEDPATINRTVFIEQPIAPSVAEVVEEKTLRSILDPGHNGLAFAEADDTTTGTANDQYGVGVGADDGDDDDDEVSSSASHAEEEDDEDLLEGIVENEGEASTTLSPGNADGEGKEKHKRDKQERKRQKKEKKEKKRLRKLEKEAKKQQAKSSGGKVASDAVVAVPKAAKHPAPKKAPTEAALERQRKKEEQEHEKRKLAAFHNSQAVLAQSAPSMNLSAALSNAFSNPNPPPPAPHVVVSGDGVNGNHSQHSSSASVTVPVVNEDGSCSTAGVKTNPPTPSNLSPTTQQATAPIPVTTTSSAKTASRRPVLSAPPPSVCAMTKSFLAKVKSQQDAKITQRLNIGRCVMGTTGAGGTNSNAAKSSRTATTTPTTKKALSSSSKTVNSSSASSNYLTEMSPLLDGGSNAAVTFPIYITKSEGYGRDDNTDDGDDSSVSSAGTDVCVVDADEDDNRLTNNLSISNFGTSKNGNTAALFALRRNATDGASQPKTPTTTTPTDGVSSGTTDLLRRISSFSSSGITKTSHTTTTTTSTLFSATAASAAKQTSKTTTTASSSSTMVTGMKRSRSTLSAIAAGIPVASNRRLGGGSKESDEEEAEDEVTELEKEHARSVIRRQEIRRLQTHYQQTQGNTSLVSSGGGQQQQNDASLMGHGESQTIALATASHNAVNGGGTNGFVANGARLLARRRSAFVSEIAGKEDIDSSSNVGGGAGTNSNSVARMLKRTNSVENSRVTHKAVVFGANGTSDQ